MNINGLSSLRARMLLLAVLSVLPAAALIGYQGWQSSQTAADQTLAQSRQLARVAADQYQQLVDHTRRLLETLAELDAAEGYDALHCTMLVRKFQTLNPEFANLGVTNAAGDILCSATPFKAANLSDRRWFRDVTTQHRFGGGELVTGRVLNKPVVVFGYPAYANEELKAVYFASLDLNWFGELGVTTRLPAGSTVTVFDEARRVLSRYPNPQEWRDKSYGGAIAETILRENKEGTAILPGSDGVTRFYAYSVLSAPWQTGQLYLNIGIPKAVVASEINRTLSYTLSGLAAAGGLTLLAVWAAGRRLLLQPVHRLIATAARLGGGDLGARSELTSHRSELGQLAQTLDAMAAALQLREGELQRTNAALKATEEETRHAKELLDRLFCNTNVLFAYLDRDFNFIRVNCAYARADGRTPDHFPGKNHFDLFPSDENHAIFRRVVETGEPYETYAKPFEYAHAPERGMTYWDWSLHPVKDAAGRVTGLVLGVINATERIKAEERVRFLQRYDELTGLPKLGALSERLREAIHDALKDGRQVAVLCLDIDRFKYINDQRGQVMGDRLLAAVAQRLTGCVRRGDVVARLTGDEFAVVLADLAQREDLLAVLRKLTACVDKTFGVDGEEYRLTCSVGVTLCPLDGSDPKQLLGNAEAAMYRAKEQGGNNVQFYSAEISAVAADYLQTYTALGRALERGELLLHYQPQVDAKSGRINAVEALLRWRHPEQGLVSPARFIPLAEETGLIVPIGAWVLNKACADARDWIEAGFPVRVAVNLSARQFHEPALLDTLRRALADSRLPRGLLELEFTESALMHDSAATREFLREAKALGVQFALDDFGTGYSSLSYLKRFPLDTLKIDRSFVSNIATHSDDAAIATAIIAMAHNLDKQVVAEGVETGAQLEFLRRHGCDSVQGYYFSRPVPAADFAQMLRAGKRLEPAREPAVAG